MQIQRFALDVLDTTYKYIQKLCNLHLSGNHIHIHIHEKVHFFGKKDMDQNKVIYPGNDPIYEDNR